MANGTTHRLVAAATIGAAMVLAEREEQEKSAQPFVGAVLAAGLTNLPDVIEPATNPHHRQFFHSLAFAGLLGLGTWKVYNWEPNHPLDKALRFALLVGAASYMVHLVLDAGTAKSLPLVGQL
jgi:membrane-bound metal-dependent hydrolase YbcI (DUF457 family)